jgi:hypothetical protein
MGIKNIALLLLTTGTFAGHTPGDIDAAYTCTYDDTAAVYLDLTLDNTLVKCGLINDKKVGIYAPNLDYFDPPTIKLNGATADDFYTVMMDTGDRVGEPYGPIMHWLVVNVKGSDLATEFSSLSIPSDADNLIEYFRPNPPVPFRKNSYSYAVYKQENGDTDFSAQDLTTMMFARQSMIDTYSLTLVDTNYYFAKGTAWSSTVQFWQIMWSLMPF